MSRRSFLKSAGLAAGGLVIAIHLPGAPANPSAGEGDTLAPNAFLRIAPDDTVTFYCDKSEMGQGVYTALPMILAEELGADIERIRIEFAPAAAAFANAFLAGQQATGASSSVRDAWIKLRKAGAQARSMLVTAAANEWRAEASGPARRKRRRHLCGRQATPDVRRACGCSGQAPRTHGSRPQGAQRIQAHRYGPPPSRHASQDRRLGRFGIDVRLPGMLYASLAQPPVLGGKVKSFDAQKTKAMPGVRDVVQTSTGIAVVADTFWQAYQARDALSVEWEPGPNAALDDAAILRGLKQASAREGIVARSDGDAETALKSSRRVLTAAYELPLLAHATLEPQNCTADVKSDGCDVYVPTQAQGKALAVAATASGLPVDKVRIHTTFLGGGFGRRLDVDFIPAAVETSRAVGQPVKLLWTREDDTTHDIYRPPAYNICTGAFDRRRQADRLETSPDRAVDHGALAPRCRP